MRTSEDPKRFALHLRLNDTERRKVEDLARAKGKSMSDVMRELIRHANADPQGTEAAH